MHLKKIAVMLIVIACAFSAFSQNVSAGEPNASEVGVDSAQQKLKEVSVSKFEDPGFWYSTMPRDLGVISTRRMPGSPLDKEPIPDEEELGISGSDEYVLGVKVQYYKRAMTYFNVYPIRPLAIEGITKTVSVWVVGRNVNHTLTLLVSDFFGNKAEITMGKLNFTGWKQMTVAIPPGIIQRDYHYTNKMGLKIEGFRVNCDPAETIGNYFVYFDDLRAVTDLFSEESRDVDDIQDNW